MNKTQITTALVVMVLIAGGFWIFNFFTKDKGESFVYEVLVQVRDKKSSNDPVEDAKTSFKKGDVLLTKKGESSWSATEKVSYLILKMELTEDQNQKLTMSVEKEMDKKEIKKELEQFKENREGFLEEEIEKIEEELKQRKEIVAIRKYRINMEEFFSDFVPTDLIQGQPYQKEVYDWSMVEIRPRP